VVCRGCQPQGEGEKMQTSFGKRMAGKRAKTVEPVLGTLITFMAMRRANARGIEQSNKHVMMAALCYNLKKYIKFIRPKVQSLAIALIKDQNWIEVPRFASMRADLSDFIRELMITRNKQ
jgi:hypothetical protein